MSKVIVERPRPGSRSPTEGKFRQTLKQAANDAMLGKDLDEVDELGRLVGMQKLHKERRSFNEYLAPLRRFVLSRVGHRWDDVYSEICEHLNRDSTVHDHIFQHLYSYVERNTFLGADGEIYVCSEYGRGDVNVNDYYCDTYVHPVTGVLCKPNVKSRKREAQERRERERRKKYRIVSDRLMFERDEDIGAWFAVDIESAEAYWERVEKYSTHRTSKSWFTYDLKQRYGAAVRQIPGTRRSASKKDIKKYELNRP